MIRGKRYLYCTCLLLQSPGYCPRGSLEGPQYPHSPMAMHKPSWPESHQERVRWPSSQPKAVNTHFGHLASQTAFVLLFRSHNCNTALLELLPTSLQINAHEMYLQQALLPLSQLSFLVESGNARVLKVLRQQ